MAVLTPATQWPPLVRVTIAGLAAALPDVPVVYDTTTVSVAGVGLRLNEAVQQVPGVVQVIRTPGGGSGTGVTEYANIDLYFYGRDVGSVETLAQRGHSAMLLLRSVLGWVIDDVRCEASPGDVPYSDPLVVRWVGSYQVASMPQQ